MMATVPSKSFPGNTTCYWVVTSNNGDTGRKMYWHEADGEPGYWTEDIGNARVYTSSDGFPVGGAFPKECAIKWLTSNTMLPSGDLIEPPAEAA